MSEIYQLPENGNNNGNATIPFSIPIGFGGMGGGFFGGNNTGMAVSRDDLKMTAIFISKCSDPIQFWSTLNHELYHANVAIIDYYGKPHGELMRQAVMKIGLPCY